MAAQITCECSYTARGSDVDEVVTATEEHLRSDHPDMAAAVTHEDIRSWVEFVPD